MDNKVKNRILYLKEILEKYTDDEHPLTTSQIVQLLEKDYSLTVVCFEPPSVDQRIANQYSFFSVMPSGISDLEEFLDTHTGNTVKYIIDKSLRWELRDILDQFNINERMIYPGKTGIAKWLARHYYVK